MNMAVGIRRLLGIGRRFALQIHPRASKPVLPRWQPVNSAKQLRVGIVGAGISGLVTARVLSDLGHQVTVYEAQKRVGGRIHTIKLAGDHGLLAEAGAGRFADTHANTLYWLNRFSIPLEPIYPEVGRLVRLDGKHRRVGPDASWLSSNTVHELVHHPNRWKSRHGRNKESVLSFVGDSLMKPMWYQINGGASQLPEALAATLVPNLHLDTIVTGISQSPEGVEIHMDEATEKFDRAVVTTPISIQHRIDFHPPLSRQRRAAVEELQVQSSIRVFVALQGREWMRDGVCGWGCMENGIEVWRPKSGANSENCVVVAYAQGESARPLVALDRHEREQSLLARLDDMFPGLASATFAVSSHCWDDESWAKGAQTTNRGSDWEMLSQPEGRVHFAGEFYSPTGWVNGAIESGYRVVSEICEAGIAERK